MRPRSAGDQQIHPVSHGTWLYRGFFSNSAVIGLDSGAKIVIDTQVAPLAAARLREQAERVAPGPIQAVINTHFHGDHTGGNALFADCPIFASEDTAAMTVSRDGERVEYAETFGLEFETLHAVPPATHTFRGRHTLPVDGEPVELLQLGAAETPDASVVWLPRRGVAATGDGVSTLDYPYLGSPLTADGLHYDGEWTGFLDRVAELDADVLLPGHGPAITGRPAVRARLALLRRLFTDLLETVAEEWTRSAGCVEETVARSLARLRRYPAMPGLREHTVSQRFAVYRCLNSLIPGRENRGWWQDLRPSLLSAADRDAIERAAGDASALGRMADTIFNRARGTRPFVDATEYFAVSARCAKAALALQPDEPLARLNLGCVRTFGAMVLAQPMRRARADLEAALASPKLDTWQRAKGRFFLGKTWQFEHDTSRALAEFRQALPWAARPLFGLVRQRMLEFP